MIVADKLTLTGSIGVFGMILDTREALKNKLGITIDGVQSNASSSFLATQPLTPVQRSMIMRGVDKVYTTFTNDVAEGRNLPIEKVLDIAGGRVWSGADALGIGLIDTYGGLKTAIALAVDKADLGDNYRVTEVTETPTGFAAFIASLNMSVREAFTRSELGADDEGLQHRPRSLPPAGRADVLALQGRDSVALSFDEKKALHLFGEPFLYFFYQSKLC